MCGLRICMSVIMWFFTLLYKPNIKATVGLFKAKTFDNMYSYYNINSRSIPGIGAPQTDTLIYICILVRT